MRTLQCGQRSGPGPLHTPALPHAPPSAHPHCRLLDPAAPCPRHLENSRRPVRPRLHLDHQPPPSCPHFRHCSCRSHCPTRLQRLQPPQAPRSRSVVNVRPPPRSSRPRGHPRAQPPDPRSRRAARGAPVSVHSCAGGAWHLLEPHGGPGEGPRAHQLPSLLERQPPTRVLVFLPVPPWEKPPWAQKERGGEYRRPCPHGHAAAGFPSPPSAAARGLPAKSERPQRSVVSHPATYRPLNSCRTFVANDVFFLSLWKRKATAHKN